MAPRAPRNSRHGLRPRIITERISDQSRTPPRTRTRPVDTSSTWYMPELSPARDARREVPSGGDHDLRPDTLVDRLPPPRVLPPNAANHDRGPVMTPSSTPDSESDGSIRPHPGASSFRHPRRWYMALVNFYRNSLLPSATRTSNHSRRGHKVSWMRPTYKTIARSLRKPAEEVKQAWKVYQRLEARN